MDNARTLLESLPLDLQSQVRQSVPLNSLTTLRVGGPAALLCRVSNPEQALRFQALALERQIPFFILGGGSNVLADDRGFQGLILHISTENLDRKGDTVRAGAGISLDDLIERTLDLGLTGLEFASGIPGTLGGALVGNAGCYGHEIGEFLVEALLLRPDGRLETVGPEEFGFRYRETDLRETGTVVLEAVLKLQRGDVDQAAGLRQEKILDRRTKHPVDVPSAGSWFRNLPAAEPGGRRRAAGVLLEQAGAKDMSEGDARVFAKHANMIINAGAATSTDVLKLAARMQSAVWEKFEVRLVKEVRYLEP
ncbi:MAG: UDP-N-acetylmuramate dehydrogenase [Candidatus Krumholzibacteria bacterium]|nr:UDP-N-acetylmuramate dehydrogenase [Candidatus Krumholzibacteria bacterium]